MNEQELESLRMQAREFFRWKRLLDLALLPENIERVPEIIAWVLSHDTNNPTMKMNMAGVVRTIEEPEIGTEFPLLLELVGHCKANRRAYCEVAMSGKTAFQDILHPDPNINFLVWKSFAQMRLIDSPNGKQNFRRYELHPETLRNMVHRNDHLYTVKMQANLSFNPLCKLNPLKPSNTEHGRYKNNASTALIKKLGLKRPASVRGRGPMAGSSTKPMNIRTYIDTVLSELAKSV